jgi:hypothetical protein
MTPMLDEQTAESRLSCFEPCGLEAIPGGQVLSCDVPRLRDSTGGICSKHRIDRRRFPALMIEWPPPH